jgi:hypothetical protein
MSKWTSYGKNYRPDVRFVRMSVDVVQTSARVRVYPADGFLLSADVVKTVSTWTRAHVSVRTRRDTRRADLGPRRRGSGGA